MQAFLEMEYKFPIDQAHQKKRKRKKGIMDCTKPAFDSQLKLYSLSLWGFFNIFFSHKTWLKEEFGKELFCRLYEKTKYADECRDNELKKDSVKRVLLEKEHDATCIFFSQYF